MTRAATATIQAIIEPAVAILGYELVGCELIRQGRRSLLRVFLDSPNGITIDDCERASRQIAAVMDVEDPITGEYDLEVSSPGMERPLFTLEHYQRFIGSKARIKLQIPQNGRRNYLGVITGVEAENIIVEGDGQRWELPFALIEKANLEPDY